MPRPPTATPAPPTATPLPEVRLKRDQLAPLLLKRLDGYKNYGDEWSDDGRTIYRQFSAEARKTTKIGLVSTDATVYASRSEAQAEMLRMGSSSPDRYIDPRREPLSGLGEKALLQQYGFAYRGSVFSITSVMVQRGNVILEVSLQADDGHFDVAMARGIAESLDGDFAKATGTVMGAM
jgi:hypothetical protein